MYPMYGPPRGYDHMMYAQGGDPYYDQYGGYYREHDERMMRGPHGGGRQGGPGFGGYPRDDRDRHMMRNQDMGPPMEHRNHPQRGNPDYDRRVDDRQNAGPGMGGRGRGGPGPREGRGGGPGPMRDEHED